MKLYAIYGRKVGTGINLKVSPPNAPHKPMAHCELYGTLPAENVATATTKLAIMARLMLSNKQQVETGSPKQVDRHYMNCFECPLHAMPKTCGLNHLDCLLGSGTKIPKGYETLKR